MNIDTNQLDISKQNERIAAWYLGVEIEWYDESSNCWHLAIELYNLEWSLRKYRRKPIETPKRNITIPQCLTEEPKIGAVYWIVHFNGDNLVAEWMWEGGWLDKRLLANGLCFATEEDAKAVVAAMML